MNFKHGKGIFCTCKCTEDFCVSDVRNTCQLQGFFINGSGYTPEVGAKLFFEAAAGGLEPIFDGDVSNRYEVADFCCETVKEYFDNRTL